MRSKRCVPLLLWFWLLTIPVTSGWAALQHEPVHTGPQEAAELTVWYLWSSESTWEKFGVGKPQEGDVVTIPEGYDVLLDESPPPLEGIFVEGALHFAAQDLEFTADYIIVNGLFQVGSEEEPYMNRAVITLAGNYTEADQSIGHCGVKVLCADGGRLELHGASPSPAWTRLEDGFTAHAGDRHIRIEEPVSWQPGDEIVIVSTDFDPDQAERRIIETISDDGRTVTFAEPLYYMHWGEIMEYAGRPVDQRAEIMHLSRNILIQGDEASVDTNFGGHVMILSRHFGHMHDMDMDDDAWGTMWNDPEFANRPEDMSHVSGVELFRMGQTGYMGRYPMHFHMVGNAEGAYIENSSVHDSYQRCYTLHGTFGMRLENNVAYKSVGHCYFLESFIERDISLIRNIGAVMDYYPYPSQELVDSDDIPSIFWISFPTNTLIGNVAAGVHGIGIWIDLRDTGGSAHNEFAEAPMGAVRDNVVHSTVLGGRLDLHAYGDPEKHGGAGFMYEGGVGPIHNLNAYKNMFNFWADESSDFELIDATFSDAHSSVWQRRDGSFNSLFVAHTDNVGTPVTAEEKRIGRSIPPFMPTHPNLISAVMGFYSKSFSIDNTFVGYRSDDTFERGVASIGATSFDAPIFFEGSTMIDSDPFVPTPARQRAGNGRPANRGQARSRKPQQPPRPSKRSKPMDTRGAIIIDFDGSLTGSDSYREVRVGPPIMTSEAAGCRLYDTKFDQPIHLCTTRSRRFGSFSGVSVSAGGMAYQGKDAGALFLPTNQVYEVDGPPRGQYFTREGYAGEFMVLKFTRVNRKPTIQPNSRRDTVREAGSISEVTREESTGLDHLWYYDETNREFWLRLVTGKKANNFGEANVDDGVRQPFSMHYGVRIL